MTTISSTIVELPHVYYLVDDNIGLVTTIGMNVVKEQLEITDDDEHPPPSFPDTAQLRYPHITLVSRAYSLGRVDANRSFYWND